jgi:hypothetical protein
MRVIARLIGVNYFYGSTTTILTGCRQVLDRVLPFRIDDPLAGVALLASV